MGPCWHIVVLILSFLETMYRTCRKGFGYWQLPHTFLFIWVSAWNSYGNKSNLCVILCICLAFNNSPVYHIHPNSKRNMNHGSRRVQKEAKSNFFCNIQQASQSGGCISGKEINQQKKIKVVFICSFCVKIFISNSGAIIVLTKVKFTFSKIQSSKKNVGVRWILGNKWTPSGIW